MSYIDYRGRVFSEYLSTPADMQMVFDNTYYPSIEKLSHLDNISSQSFWGIDKKQGDYPPFWDKHASFVRAMESICQYIKRKNSSASS